MHKASLAAALFLTACTSTVTTTTPPPAGSPAGTPDIVTVTMVRTDPLTALVNRVSEVAIPDLRAALVDANAHNDVIAAQCYSGLIPIIQGLQAKLNAQNGSPSSTITGLVLVFQKARDLKGNLASSQSDLQSLRKAVNLACGALQIDVQAGVADPMGLFSGQ